jgi:hypothetical protein
MNHLALVARVLRARVLVVEEGRLTGDTLSGHTAVAHGAHARVVHALRALWRVLTDDPVLRVTGADRTGIIWNAREVLPHAIAGRVAAISRRACVTIVAGRPVLSEGLTHASHGADIGGAGVAISALFVPLARRHDLPPDVVGTPIETVGAAAVHVHPDLSAR